MSVNTSYDQNLSGSIEEGRAAAERATNRMADGADGALQAAQRKSNDVLSSLTDSVNDLRTSVPSALQRAADGATDMSHRAMQQARHAREAAMERADRVGSQTRGYIRQDPLKAVLIAAAAGALLVGLSTLFSRNQR